MADVLLSDDRESGTAASCNHTRHAARAEEADRPIKLGILANEFFDPSFGRLGGFGWVARQLARLFADPSLGVRPVFLTGELMGSRTRPQTVVYGTRLILRRRWAQETLRARAEHLDLLLSIDYRPNYRRILYSLPRVPKLFWVRDPRSPDDVRRVHDLRLPGQNGIQPKGTFQPDCSSLGTLARASRWLRTPLLFAGTAAYLEPKLATMIGGDAFDQFHFLPNPIDAAPKWTGTTDPPLVVFLGRLDPYKRPWLFVELARRFPHVAFAMAGRRHHVGSGAWEPHDLPANLRLLGHVDGADKTRLLASATALVNTSIHEGLAVSLLEGLAFGVPLLSCVDPEGIASRFGIYAGDFPGSGEAALPALEQGLSRLLSSPDLRRRCGESGRRWIEQTHTPLRFLAAFDELCTRLGVRPRPSTLEPS